MHSLVGFASERVQKHASSERETEYTPCCYAYSDRAHAHRSEAKKEKAYIQRGQVHARTSTEYTTQALHKFSRRTGDRERGWRCRRRCQGASAPTKTSDGGGVCNGGGTGDLSPVDEGVRERQRRWRRGGGGGARLCFPFLF